MKPPSPQPGEVYRSPINAIGTKFPNMNVPALGVWISSHSILEQGGEIWPILRLRVTEAERTWEQLYIKMEWFVSGLSIGTLTHCWLSDYIYDESGHEVWRKPGTLEMVVEKEGDPQEREDTPANLMPLMVDLSLHVALNYPRVFVYHHIGLLLLRTPLVAYNLNAEVVLNFFKIGELVTATRTGKKPTLQSILYTSAELEVPYTKCEISDFYKVRSRDAAHDHRQVQHIKRELAVIASYGRSC